MTISEQLQEMFPDAEAEALLLEALEALTAPLLNDPLGRELTDILKGELRTSIMMAKAAGLSDADLDKTGAPLLFAELHNRLGTLAQLVEKIQERRLDKKPVR